VPKKSVHHLSSFERRVERLQLLLAADAPTFLISAAVGLVVRSISERTNKSPEQWLSDYLKLSAEINNG
jgi:hypothetical protein